MATTIPLITRSEEISSEWLAAILTQGGVENSEISGFEAESIGTGQVGENIRISLRYANAEGMPPGDDDRPASLVLKLPSPNEVSRSTAVAQGIYAREVHFYREIAPSVAIRTPRVWHADVSADGARFVLAFEDLAPAVPGDQLRGCSPEEAALAMVEAARLHAPRWNDPGLGQLEWLTQPSPESAVLLETIYAGVLPGFEERFAERLPGDVLALARRFGQKVGAWAAEPHFPRCVSHGDFRLDNMLFGPPGSDSPLAVVDWQTCARGHPASDVSYFLGAGLLPDERRKHEESLLAQYLDALRGAGVEDYGPGELHEDYRRFSFSGLVMAVVASQIVEVSERGDAMFAAMASRHAEQILDLDAEAILK